MGVGVVVVSVAILLAKKTATSLSQGTSGVGLMVVEPVDGPGERMPITATPSTPVRSAPMMLAEQPVRPAVTEFVSPVVSERADDTVAEPTHSAAPASREQRTVPATASGAQIRDAEAAISFDGRPLRKVRTIEMTVTAYSPDERSCGKWADGQTASGYSVWTNGMKLVAADTRILPFGSIVSVPGYNGGKPVPVLDRGGKIKGNRLDVLYPTHEIARRWGVKKLTVTVWAYADE